MAFLKPGDPVLAQCQEVDNLPTRMLGLQDGLLAEIPGTGEEKKGSLFLASRKADYIADFAAQGLTICEDFHPFDAPKAPLRLALESQPVAWGLVVQWEELVVLAPDADVQGVLNGGTVLSQAIPAAHVTHNLLIASDQSVIDQLTAFGFIFGVSFTITEPGLLSRSFVIPGTNTASVSSSDHSFVIGFGYNFGCTMQPYKFTKGVLAPTAFWVGTALPVFDVVQDPLGVQLTLSWNNV